MRTIHKFTENAISGTSCLFYNEKDSSLMFSRNAWNTCISTESQTSKNITGAHWWCKSPDQFKLVFPWWRGKQNNNQTLPCLLSGTALNRKGITTRSSDTTSQSYAFAILESLRLQKGLSFGHKRLTVIRSWQKITKLIRLYSSTKNHSTKKMKDMTFWDELFALSRL